MGNHRFLNPLLIKETRFTLMDGYRIIDVTPQTGRFSKRELFDILAAMVVLSVAFTILYRNSSFLHWLGWNYGEPVNWAILFLTCVGLVFFSFLLHEFGHKFVAQKHGARSEFRMYPMGLVITLITSMFGFLFAAPGAVVIQGQMSQETNGKVSIAGPMVNIVLSAIGIVGCIALNHTPAVFVMLMLASLNGFLAFFNLLPIPPMDGSKILGWNKVIWVVAFAVAIIELLFYYLWMPDLYFA